MILGWFGGGGRGSFEHHHPECVKGSSLLLTCVRTRRQVPQQPAAAVRDIVLHEDKRCVSCLHVVGCLLVCSLQSAVCCLPSVVWRCRGRVDDEEGIPPHPVTPALLCPRLTLYPTTTRTLLLQLLRHRGEHVRKQKCRAVDNGGGRAASGAADYRPADVQAD